MKTEQPMRTKIMRPVRRCSRIPRNLGCSPGAEHSDSSFRLFTWLMERTVAATNHGSPMMEHTPSMTPTMSRSRWYPHPFCAGRQKHNSSFTTGKERDRERRAQVKLPRCLTVRDIAAFFFVQFFLKISLAASLSFLQFLVLGSYKKQCIT